MIPIRYLVYFAAAIGSTAVGTLYSSMNFAWVCMVRGNSSVGKNYTDDKLDWSNDQQQIIFAGYNIGSLLLSVPAGWVINKFGSRLLYSLSLMSAGVATLLIPLAAHHASVGGVTVLRIVSGLGGAVFFPITFDVCSKWAPKTELGTALALGTIGFPAGQFAGILLAGLECRNVGWEYIFYLTGAFAAVLSILWFLFYRNGPDQHRLVSQKERKFIAENKARRSNAVTIDRIPWFGILTNFAVWSCVICRFLAMITAYSVTTFTPTFVRDRLNLREDINGYVSSLPLLASMISRFLSGWLSDWRIVGDTARVKILNTICFAGSGLCALGVTFLPAENPSVGGSIALLFFIMFFIAFFTGGHMKAPLYMAPQFSAVIGSLINTSGCLSAIFVPFIIDQLTTHKTRAEWNHVFYIVLGVGVAGTLVFLIFGSGERQGFAKDVEEKKEDKGAENGGFEITEKF